MSSKRPPSIKKKCYIEIDYHVLQETGEIKVLSEPILMPEITTVVPRGKFEVTYTAELFDIMRELGTKKMEVFCFLLDNKDSQNQINTTQREIAKETNCSVVTVNETIRTLTNAGLLTRKGTVYMVSPNLMVKGNQVREAYLMRKFVEMDEHRQFEVIESEIEGQLALNDNGDIVEIVK
jgi:hypothetical protein